MKKYYRGDNKEAARLARAHAQAKVDDQEELFERALERGVLEQEIREIISQSEYLDEKGIDADDVDEYVEQLLSSPGISRSHQNVLKDALREQDNPDLDDIIAFADEFGMDKEATVLKLEKLLRSDEIEPPENISLSDVEAEADAILEIDRSEDELEDADESSDPSLTSQQGILEQAAREHKEGPVSAILDFAENRGLARDVAVLHLEKLVRSGQLPLPISLSEIEEVADDLLDIEDNNDRPEKPEQTSKSSSQREILENAVEDLDDPTIDEVVQYSTGHGMTEEQALSGLEKMLRSGQIAGSSNLDMVVVRERRQALSNSRDSSKSDADEEYESDLEKSSMSQRDIIVKPIEDMDAPTREDVLDFAVEHGMSREKAESYLEKLIASGDVSRKPDHTLRVL